MANGDIYYHVTPAEKLDRIREEGLVPSAEWAGYGPDADPEEVEGLRRVFLCDRRSGADRYRDYFGKAGPVVILTVAGPALQDVEPDEAMRGDCYVTESIPVEAIEILNPDGSFERLRPASLTP